MKLMLGLVSKTGVEFWHDADREPWATIPVNGHWENHPLYSKAFGHWIKGEHFRRTQLTIRQQALDEAIEQMASRAVFASPRHEVSLRLAERDSCIYLDLADDQWRAIKVSKQGWTVVSRPPVKFRRSAGMRPLPEPVPGGTIDELRPFVNVGPNSDFVLVVAWLLMALRPKHSHPVLILCGEQGSAKSTTCRFLRDLIDPNLAVLRTIPRNERDLVLAADNGWVLGFDNLSGVAPHCSDALCRIATGAGFSTRRLYTDREETILSVTRPVLLNGIEEAATRADLLDRSIVLKLISITDERRRSEDELEKSFDEARPRILGALLTAASCALRRLDKSNLPTLSRMADFVRWVTAAEPKCPWAAGAFNQAYRDNRSSMHVVAIEESNVGCALRSLLRKSGGRWRGTLTRLLGALERITKEVGRCLPHRWPAAPNKLSSELRRLGPSFRSQGITISFDKSGHKSERIVTVVLDQELPNNRPHRPRPLRKNREGR